jgi:ABC-type branched-subunit amino acid transport system substrate-binding protein
MESCGELTDVQAKASGILVETRYNWSATTTINDQAIEELKYIIKDLKTRSVDIVFACAFGQSARYILEEMKTQNYAPSFVTFLPLDQQYNAIDPALSNYITGCSRFDAFALFPNDPVFGDTQLFVQSFEKQYGSMPDDFAAFGAMSGVIYQTALRVKAICDSNGTINIS